MRNNIRQLLITALVAAQVLSMSACKDNTGNNPLPDRPVSQVVSITDEFSPTSEDNWVDSNYKQFWFKPSEETYNELIDKLVAVRSIDNGGHVTQLYKIKTDNADTAKEYIIMGNELFSVDHMLGINHLDAQTGKKLWFVESEEERQELLTTDYSDGVWVNGVRQQVLSVSDIVSEIDGTEMLNLTIICNSVDLMVRQNGQTITVKNHYLPECDNSVVVELSDTPQEVLNSQTGNMYYSAVSSNNHVFATPTVIKNIIGWDVTITNTSVVVWTDELYRPTEETIFVYSSKEDVEPQESETSAPVIEEESEEHDPSEALPEDTQEDIDRQNENISNQNSQAQQNAGNTQKLPKTFDELPEEWKKEFIAMYKEVFGDTEAEAIERYNAVSRETTSTELQPEYGSHVPPTGNPSPIWK